MSKLRANNHLEESFLISNQTWIKIININPVLAKLGFEQLGQGYYFESLFVSLCV